MSNRIKIISKKINEDFKIIEIENQLKVFQEFVGGNIEVVSFVNNSLIVLNENGRFDCSPNISILGEILYGDFLIVGIDGEDFSGLNENQIKKITNMF